MAAKIIPFPQFVRRSFTVHRGRHAAKASGLSDTRDGIHLVGTPKPEDSVVNAEARRETQRQALRIVQEVQQEWNDRRHPAHVVRGERPAHFWDELPLPQPQRETPLAVARRLMHMLLSNAKTA